MKKDTDTEQVYSNSVESQRIEWKQRRIWKKMHDNLTHSNVCATHFDLFRAINVELKWENILSSQHATTTTHNFFQFFQFKIYMVWCVVTSNHG